MVAGAAIYSRLSRDPEGDLLGVTRQEEDCRRLLANEGITDPEVYRDNSMSAWKRNRRRPGWDAMLADIHAGKITSVAIYHPDRLVRQPRDLETLFEIAETRAVRLLSTGGGRNLDDPSDRFILRVEAALACRSSDDTSRRLKRKFQQMAEEGLPHGGPRPFGLTQDRKELEPREAALVRDAAARLLAGDSLRSVTGSLNATGIPPTGKSTTWSPQTVRQMLTRPSIAGLRQYRGEIMGDARHPAILDKETWTALVALLRDPSRRMSRPAARVHLLSGLARCGRCDAGLRRTVAHAHSRYWCPSCFKIAIAQAPLDLLVTTAALERLRDVRRPAKPADLRVGKRILALSARLDELTTKASDTTMPLYRLEKMITQVEEELSRAKREQAEHLNARVLATVDSSVAESWADLPLLRRRAILDALIEKIVVSPAVKRGQRFDPARVQIVWR